MTKSIRIALPLLALILSGCASTTQYNVAQAPAAAPVMAAPVLSGPTPAQTTLAALQTTNVSSGFIDPGAASLMSAADNSAANSAQFYALQFGRPGAPRAWTGGKGTTGAVTVGPYVRVNNLDCRDFTHTVRINGQEFTRKGTACREQTGNWTVVPTAA
ncbi:hypothetical protein [Devosia sp.]|uniref:hypothetical protein n=1 Tax=Devosia sp. TaxID=1871048 RepID=UPI003267C97D